MSVFHSSTARHISSILQNYLIPWAPDDAHYIHFGTPPRALSKFGMKWEHTITPPLPNLKRHKAYPHVQSWAEENLNSIDVPVLGCVFDGKTTYQVRRPPGEVGEQWSIPVQSKTFFLIPPGTPFTRGIGDNHTQYARTILIHSRRDCISCFTYSIDQGKVWQNPYIHLHEFDAQHLIWRLMNEWKKPTLSSRIISQYTLIILELMLRSIIENRFTDKYGVSDNNAHVRSVVGDINTHKTPIQYAKAYISEHLRDTDLSVKKTALNVGISSRQLERVFRQKMKMSPLEYIQLQRLEKAKMLLHSRSLSIRHVAYHCGFRYASHFSRWFGKQMGCSPRQYQNNVAK